MKWTILVVYLFVVTLTYTMADQCYSQDMRQINIQAEQAKMQLIAKANKEKQDAELQAQKSRKKIQQDHLRLQNEISKLQQKEDQLKAEVTDLDRQNNNATVKEKKLSEKLTTTNQMIHELIGVIRINAKDIDGLISTNHYSEISMASIDVLHNLSDENSFPGMAAIHQLEEIIFNNITKSGEVTKSKGKIINRDGKSVEAEITILGPFTAVYKLDREIGFLRYSATTKRFYALLKLPTKRMQKQISSYISGESDSVIMDITKGAALQQLTHSLSLWEQIIKGGPIVWPILLLFFVGIFIVVERIFFMFRKHMNSEKFMQQLIDFSAKPDWKACEDVCKRFNNKPVARVISGGLLCRDLSREEMENVLQEAILREIPPLERFLSTLGMLAAIAPLLGLLGTVTGMIDTFHIITLHGTGDPRLMSGGISEALVTTMLGLGVAIPLMLAQTLLNRSVEKEIGVMEEKAVALVNIIHKSKLEPCT